MRAPVGSSTSRSVADAELRVHVECRKVSAFCESCGLEVRLKERPLVSLNLVERWFA
jgi:hypothetical protein